MKKVYHATQLPLFITSRICRTCGIEKSQDDFYPNRRVCKVCTSARCLANYKANREENLVGFKEYYAKRCEELKAKSNANYYANIEYYRQWATDYRETHKEEYNARNRAWTKANMISRCEYMRRRHALKNSLVIGEVSYDRILERDGNFCYICEGAILPEHKIDFDHVIPLSRDGAHSEDNIKVTHATCNRRKNKRLLEEMTPYQRRGIL